MSENNKSNTIELENYVNDAYLQYSVAVLKDRAIPYIHDGQKPVQRRILYVMHELGLSYENAYKKSARIVGDIIGKYHPHGDTAAYEALVRMSQKFKLRYPLIDGQGNFGTLDGDSAAAMRYTESKLTPIADILLNDLKYNCVDQLKNYDGSLSEPEVLPARLNMLLLNGADGIAVGMSTLIPSHNVVNVSDATIRLIQNPNASFEELVEDLIAPDFPTGGQIINSKESILNNYKNGFGSFTVRCKWKVEKLDRGQYQIVIYELPPNQSPSNILNKIANIESPVLGKDKDGKPKKMSVKQLNDKQFLTSMISNARDDSDSQLRLIIEPRSSKKDPEELMTALYKLLDLEQNFSMRMITVGINKKPAQKNIKEVLQEWIDFRFITLTRRTQYLLKKALDRIHILEGRQIVFDHLTEVIEVIRNSDEPKNELMSKFSLSEVQAEDILEIKLRSLARMEIDKIVKELDKQRKEAEYHKELLASERKMKNLMIKEIKEDTEKLKDERRTLVKEESAAKIVESQVMLAEKVTIIVTEQGWLTQRKGFEIDTSTIQLKDGDNIKYIIEGKTNQPIVILSSSGRLYNIKITDIATGKNFNHLNSISGMSGDTIVDILFVEDNINYLVANNGGYGFIVNSKEFIVKNRAGKIFISLGEGDVLYPFMKIEDNKYILCSSTDHRLLSYNIDEVKELPKGKGFQLLRYPEGQKMNNIKLIKELENITVNIGGKDQKLNLVENKVYANRTSRGQNLKEIIKF